MDLPPSNNEPDNEELICIGILVGLLLLSIAIWAFAKYLAWGNPSFFMV